MPAGNAGCAGTPVGLWLGCLGSRFLRASGETARRRAVDRRARQSRILRARAGRAGGASSIRGRSRRGRTATIPPTTRSAISASRTRCRWRGRTRSSSCSIRRGSALRRCRRTTAMYVTYRAQFERAFALGARRPNTFFMNHHPVLAFAPNPAQAGIALSGQRAACSRCCATLEPMALFPPDVKALLSGHVHLFEVVSFSTPQPRAVRLGQRWRLGRYAAAAAARREPDAGARRRSCPPSSRPTASDS